MSWYSMLYLKDEAKMKDRAECSEKVGARFEKLRLLTTEYDYAPPLELAKQADEPPPLGRLVGYRQRRDQQLVDFGRQ